MTAWLASGVRSRTMTAYRTARYGQCPTRRAEDARTLSAWRSRTSFMKYTLRPTRVAISALTGFVFSGCNGLFYWPDREVHLLRGNLPFEVEEVRFPSGDGTSLHGWLLRHTTPGAPLGTVIHFHGNALNLTHHVRFVDWLPAEGFDVFMFDYRGYGRSQERPARRGIHLDGQAALEYVRSRPDVESDKLLVFGQSLGGAVALAAVGEGRRDGIRGMAVEASFASYRRVANTVLGGTFLTYPCVWLTISEAHSPWRSIENLAGIPLVVLHGDQDSVVPLREGEALFEAAPGPKEFWLVDGGRHGRAMTHHGDLYRKRLAGFFRRCVGMGGDTDIGHHPESSPMRLTTSTPTSRRVSASGSESGTDLRASCPPGSTR